MFFDLRLLWRCCGKQDTSRSAGSLLNIPSRFHSHYVIYSCKYSSCLIFITTKWGRLWCSWWPYDCLLTLHTTASNRKHPLRLSLGENLTQNQPGYPRVWGQPNEQHGCKSSVLIFEVSFLLMMFFTPPKKTLLCFLNRDCVVVDDGPKTGVPDHELYGRMKLLQFHENYRPAYWGTWSKKSRHISPRCPFKLDKVKNSGLFPHSYFLMSVY